MASEPKPIKDGHPSFQPDWRFKAAFAAIMVITLMAALDATSLSVALPNIATALHGTSIQAFWSGTSFLLTSTVLQPNIGSFSTIFGRKPILLGCLAFFGAGAVIAGVAMDMTVVLVGRTIQGIGGGGIIALSEILITDLVPLRERGKWTSLQSTMWSLGTIAGPLGGGAFAEYVSWRWVFYINLPILAVGTGMIVCFLRLKFPVSSFISKLKRVDWIGSFLFIASSTGFLIPISWGGSEYTWSSWRTLVPLVVCGAGLVAFVVYEEYIPSEPLILTAVFKNRTAGAIFLQNFIHGMVLWCVLFYSPLYYQAVKGFSPIMSGVALLPLSFTVAPSAAATGITIAKTGHYRWAIHAGWFLTTLGTGLFILFDVDTATAEWICLSLVSGVGFGILFPSMAVAVQAASQPEHQAYAATTFTFIRAFGQTFGVAIGGTVFQNCVRKALASYPELATQADTLSRDSTALVKTLSNMPDSPMKEHLKQSFVSGIQYVWAVMTILAAIGLISTLLVKSLSLNRNLKTDQGFQYDSGSGSELELTNIPTRNAPPSGYSEPATPTNLSFNMHRRRSTMPYEII